MIGQKTKKIIPVLLLIAIILPTLALVPAQRVSAFWGVLDTNIDVVQAPLQATNTANTGATAVGTWSQFGLQTKTFAKELGEQLLMSVARKVLQEMTKSTVNWINSGFHGAPLFLENPDSFFKDIAKYEVRTLIDVFGYDLSKFPFGRDWALNTINSYKSQLAQNSQYSLSQVTNDPEVLRNYRVDFNVGGWDGFLINTQYPENNYLGFQMKANEELLRRIEGTVQTPAQKVEATLQQGMGFLSPKMCDPAVNPNYNDGTNEWRQPSFNQSEWEQQNPYDHEANAPACYTNPPDEDLCWQQSEAYDALYEGKRSGAKTAWSFDHTCVKEDGTSGLKATTPGSVVSNQIMTAMSSSFRQTELGMAVGSSLSAVFDALLNKFIGDGLNALASKTNPPPPTEDNWNYQGLTLGVGEEDDNTSAWDGGPDVPIVLSEFKKQLSGKTIITTTDEAGTETITETVGKVAGGPYTPGDIANAERELVFISEIETYMSKIWPEARTLDVCLPGPDINWKDRLSNELQRNSKKLNAIQGDQDDQKALEAEGVLKELKFATDFFEDWINNKMLTELPSSIFYIEAIDSIEDLSQQALELNKVKRDRMQALARLNAVKIALDNYTETPEPGSAGEKVLISLKKQHDGIRSVVATAASLSDRQTELDVAKDKLQTMKDLTSKCEDEREAEGWGVPGGPTSTLSGTTNIPSTGADLGGLQANMEQAIFCSLPVTGGYTHEVFKNETGLTHPEIPMVNAKKVLKYQVWTLKGSLKSQFGSAIPNPFKKQDAYVNIQLSCNAIYNAKLLDYKGDLPGVTIVTETYTPSLPDDTGIRGTGTCTYREGTDEFEDENVTEESCKLNNGVWRADRP